MRFDRIATFAVALACSAVFCLASAFAAGPVKVFELSGDKLAVTLSPNSWDSNGTKNYNLQCAIQNTLSADLQAGDMITIEIAGASDVDIPGGLQVMIDTPAWSNAFAWEASPVSVDAKNQQTAVKAGVAFSRTIKVKIDSPVAAGKGIVALLTPGTTASPTPAKLNLTKFTIVK